MKKVLIFVVRLVIVVLFLAALPYYYSCIYTFTESKPFAGKLFYNPYEQLNNKWVKVNFHAHTKLAGGIANGKNTSEEMLAAYDSIGYDLPCISNYNSILKTDRVPYISDFEHGFNMGFVHQLVLNNKSANWFDYPLYQSVHHKQFMLNHVKKDNNLIALAHPNFKLGYSNDDLRVLTNYDLMEVLSRTATSVVSWDAALSSGHAVWAIGNDDSHEADINSIGVCWTSINVKENTSKSILSNLKKGNCVATRGWRGQNMQEVNFVKVDNGKVSIGLNSKADSIVLKSDLGKTVAFVVNDSIIEYQMKKNNTYVRAEIFETEQWNNYTRMYLNPIVRSKDGSFVAHNNKAEVSYFWTVLYWLGIMIFQSVFVFFLIRIKRRK